jgi:hypothetical protein
MSDAAKTLSRGELLKQLRETYPEGVKRAQRMLKEQSQIQHEISKLLLEKARTVPEVASMLTISSRQALWYLASMRKYNLVVENGMAGDYPLYQLAEEQ